MMIDFCTTRSPSYLIKEVNHGPLDLNRGGASDRGLGPTTAGAQSQTLDAIAPSQPPPSPPTTFQIGCHYTISAEGTWFSGDVYLLLAGTQIANTHFEQFSFLDAQLTRDVAATTDDRIVECELNSTLGSLYDNAILQGVPDGETSAFGGWYPANTTLAQ